ncbi:MAG TPA: PfkB family carbohydrate kinase [Candidatus Dormibacteraeota bacterium]
MSGPGLLVVGSIALDSLEGPYGHVTEELGGSAVYFALAASLVGSVKLVAPVGEDAEPRVRSLFAGRDVDLSGLHVLPAPTYRWNALDVGGRNRDLGSQDSIYDAWTPRPPAGFSGWAFAGSMRPDRQLEALQGLSGAELLAADAMLSYTKARPAAVAGILDEVGWFFCNRAEFRALGGREPQSFRRRHRLQGLVLKDGAAGVTAYTESADLHQDAPAGQTVVDTTGAGDALAGALLARWRLDGDLAEALAWGVAAASIAIEDVGVRALARATPRALAERRAGDGA